ncbi:MAG TPA: response regulator, partial [Geobacteraceae bacterium]
MKKVKVLIVDDSALVRQTLAEIVAADPDLEVMGTAADPYIAAEHMKSEVPDVITLDVEMPRMDGISFLRKIMTQHPIPVVMCSSLTEKGSETAMKALDYGAVEIIVKPRLGARQFLEEARIRICDAIKAASKCRVKPLPPETRTVAPKLTADAVISRERPAGTLTTTE